MTKSWEQKYRGAKPPHIAVLEKPYAGLKPGQRLFVADPHLLEARIRTLPPGTVQDIATLRADLAREHDADATCPTSTAIFLRIVAERALEQAENPAPFCRVVAPDSPLARKLSCGANYIHHRRAL